MNRTQHHIDPSIDSLPATLRRARTTHEATQQVLQNTCLRVHALQHQLHDLQQQVNALHAHYRSTYNLTHED